MSRGFPQGVAVADSDMMRVLVEFWLAARLECQQSLFVIEDGSSVWVWIEVPFTERATQACYDIVDAHLAGL